MNASAALAGWKARVIKRGSCVVFSRSTKKNILKLFDILQKYLHSSSLYGGGDSNGPSVWFEFTTLAVLGASTGALTDVDENDADTGGETRKCSTIKCRGGEFGSDPICNAFLLGGGVVEVAEGRGSSQVVHHYIASVILVQTHKYHTQYNSCPDLINQFLV